MAWSISSRVMRAPFTRWKNHRIEHVRPTSRESITRSTVTEDTLGDAGVSCTHNLCCVPTTPQACCGHPHEKAPGPRPRVLTPLLTCKGKLHPSRRRESLFFVSSCSCADLLRSPTERVASQMRSKTSTVSVIPRKMYVTGLFYHRLVHGKQGAPARVM